MRHLRLNRSRLARRAGALVGVVVASAAALAAHAPATALPGDDRFLAGESYTGSFPDPTVMKVGDLYVASATNTANLNLPVMVSRDLQTWYPRPALPDYSRYVSWRGYNDAMPIKPTWAATVKHRERVKLMSQWAPSLAKVGDHYVAAYSAAVRLNPRKSCIGIASSSSPLGLYRDTRTKPLVCYAPSLKGAIDPEVFVHPDGRAFLLWKNEGVQRVHGPRLMIRRLNAQGTGFRPGSRPKILAQRDRLWEQGIIENPSMILHEGRYYLFYSAASWRTSEYLTSYAVCKRPLGPCTKTDTKLLTTGGGIAGPGGADAIVDDEGRLRLVYAAWSEGLVGPGVGVRKLRTVTLDVDPETGTLSVAGSGTGS